MLISDFADYQRSRVKPLANIGTFVYNGKVNQGKEKSNLSGCLYELPLIAMEFEKKLLKEKEVCDLISFSKSTLWRMVGRGVGELTQKQAMDKWLEIKQWSLDNDRIPADFMKKLTKEKEEQKTLGDAVDLFLTKKREFN